MGAKPRGVGPRVGRAGIPVRVPGAPPSPPQQECGRAAAWQPRGPPPRREETAARLSRGSRASQAMTIFQPLAPAGQALSRYAPAPTPGDGHAVSTGGWPHRRRGPPGRAGRLAGTGRSPRTRQLTGTTGVTAASGSSVPATGARSPPPPAVAASPQWLGLGLGGSPESGLSRTPSPFFFVSTSSGTSCRLSRPTIAAPVAGPETAGAVLECKSGPHTRAGAAALRAALLAPPPARCPGVAGGRARSRPRPPPRPGGWPSRGDRREAKRQGPLRSRRAPPSSSGRRSSRDGPPPPAGRVAHWQGCEASSGPAPCPCGPRRSLPLAVFPGLREVLISLDLAAQSQN